MKLEEMKTAIRNFITTLWPELGAGTHLPMKAKVTRVHGQAGHVDDTNGARRYSVDVQPLLPDGNEDPNRAELRDVPLEVPWAGAARGVFALPAIGAIVRVCFYGGDPAHPYVDGIVPSGFDVPAIAPGEYLVQHSPDTRLRIHPDGRIDIESDTVVTVKSAARVDVDAPDVRLAGGGEGVARRFDDVEVIATDSLGGPVAILSARISGASSKVKAG